MPHPPHRTPSVPQLKQTTIIISQTATGVQQSNYTKLFQVWHKPTESKPEIIERPDFLCLDNSGVESFPDQLLWSIVENTHASWQESLT